MPAALLAVVLVVAGSLAIVQSRSLQAEAAAGESDAQMQRLLLVRAELAWIHLDLIADSLYAALEGAEPTDDRLEAFQRDRAAAVTALEELAAGDTEAADLAAELWPDVDAVSFEEWPYDAVDLDDQHYVAISLVVAAEVFDRQPAMTEAVRATMLPLLVANDGLVVELSKQSGRPPTWTGGYYNYTLEVVTETPGWVGPDRSAPLQYSVVAVDPEATDLTVFDGVADDELAAIWDYDQWLITEAERGFDTAPPLSIDELYETQRAAAAIRQPVVDALTAGIDEGLADASSQRMLASVLIGLGGISLVGALALGLVVVSSQRRRHHDITRAASTDPLTGAWNRRYLEDEVAGRCRRRGYHHVIAMIDLDRFKLVNDTHGHNAGDDLLICVVQRLRAVATELTASSERAVGEVVRLGGDEFAVALHHPDRFDVPEVARLLRETAGPADLGLDELVDLDFSLGLVETFEPADVSDLLKAADLGTYEDKRSRAGSAPIDGPTPATPWLDLTRR
ncbi:MAG: GGDEF domain-containing protein [Actinomycetota bacterium]